MIELESALLPATKSPLTKVLRSRNADDFRKHLSLRLRIVSAEDLVRDRQIELLVPEWHSPDVADRIGSARRITIDRMRGRREPPLPDPDFKNLAEEPVIELPMIR